MNLIKIILIYILATLYSSGQNFVQKINRENFIGQKIKFLSGLNNIERYYEFGETEKCVPFLKYSKYNGRIAKFIERKDDIFTLKMEDSDENIYLNLPDSSFVPNYIGFISLLDSARKKYLNTFVYTSELYECKVEKIDFAEETGEYSKQNGPFIVTFKLNKYSGFINVLHFSETHKPQKRSINLYEKFRVFEKQYEFNNPFSPLTKKNIEEKFFLKRDTLNNSITYIHKFHANEETSKFNSDFSNYRDYATIISKIVLKDNIPKILFLSKCRVKNNIFHSNIKVKIGDTVKESYPVNGLSEITDDELVETNYYNLPADIEILKWISNNYKKEISVNFSNKKGYKDVRLPMNVKYAIKETFDLYFLLNKK